MFLVIVSRAEKAPFAYLQHFYYSETSLQKNSEHITKSWHILNIRQGGDMICSSLL